ncbi:hypothetical protein BCR39DRAFT_534519 [Naematelia encephala]|uniref:Transcription factor tau subunit sfc3/Tfc3 C-terminal domain-containing protein n=1 Tax=Naematelia encephala TaxID=71784 RepID=A0A1Y2B2A6_9TREE|nr:hypothetical protein BCR39DRAFT_534519 [Naematelia encephala]
MVGTSQGSMHYYLKILMELELIVRVPVSLYSSITNLVLFHRFKHLNDNWNAARAKLLGIDPLSLRAQDGNAPPGVSAGDDEASASSVKHLGLSFTPLNELDLAQGFIPQQRLLQILDHPALENHLLRNKFLLSLVGWPGESALRHRRMMLKCTQSLLADGVVEMVLVGWKGTKCLRLAKYNPDYADQQLARPPRSSAPLAASDPSAGVIMNLNVEDYRQPFSVSTGGNTASLTLTVEYQATKAIVDAGGAGITISEIRQALSFYFRRALEFHLLRTERNRNPPHLQHFDITSSIETELRERRLRFHSVQAFREEMEKAGHLVDDSVFAPLQQESGHWARNDFRDYCEDLQKLNEVSGQISRIARESPAPESKAERRGGSKNLGTKKQDKKKGASNDDEAASDASSLKSTDLARPRKKAKFSKYADTSQARGRPRKYIHVVDLDGAVNRRVLGQIPPQPDLAPIYIYVPAAGKLVEGPPEYSGRGPPPTPTAEMIKKGKTPEFFAKFPSVGKSAKSRSKASKPKKEKKRKAVPKSDEGPARRSKRIRAEQTVTDAEEVDELASTGDEVEGEDELEESVSSTGSVEAGQVQVEEGVVVDDAVLVDDVVVVDDVVAPMLSEPPKLSHGRRSTRLRDSHPDQSSTPGQLGAREKITNTEPSSVVSSARPVWPHIPSSSVPVVQGVVQPEHRQTLESTPETPVAGPEATQDQVISTAEVSPRRQNTPDVKETVSTRTRQRQIALPESPVPANRTEKDPTSAPLNEPRSDVNPLPAGDTSPVDQNVPAPVDDTLVDVNVDVEVDADHDASFVPYRISDRGQEVIESASAVSFSHLRSAPRASPSITSRTSSRSTRGLLEHKSINRDAGLSGFSLDPNFQSRRSVTFRADQPLAPDALNRATKGKSKADQTTGAPAFKSKGLKSLWGTATGPTAKNTSTTPPSEIPVERHEEQTEAVAEPAPTLGSFVVSFSPPPPPRRPSSGSGSSIIVLPETDDASEIEFALPVAFTAFGEGRRKTRAELKKLDEQESQMLLDNEKRRAEARARPRRKNAGTNATRSESVDGELIAEPTPKSKSAKQKEKAVEVPSPVAGSTVTSPGSPSAPVRGSARSVPPSSIEGTPLREESETPSKLEMPRVANMRNAGRVDLGAIRRMNEVLAALRDAGGVLTLFKLSAYHPHWTKRVAGTDAPHAPSTPYTMDKTVFRATLKSLIDNNRLKMTITTTMSPTNGGLHQERVYYLPDTPVETLKAYTQSLSAKANQIYSVSKPKRKVVVADVRYSQVKGPLGRENAEARRKSLAQPEIPLSDVVTGRNEDRRMTLLKDYSITASLLGYQSGRCRRMEILHRAIIRAIHTPDTKYVVSRQPLIIALPMLFEELTIEEWLATVPTSRYDPRLEELLSTPEGRTTKLRDLSDLAADQRGGFGGYSRKERLGVLLATLEQLRVLEVLNPRSEDTPAAYTIPSANEGETLVLSISTDRRAATHYRIFDRIPIYHVADEPSTLLGVLPVSGPGDLDPLWTAIRAACLQSDRNSLPALLPAPSPSAFDGHEVSFPDQLALKIEDKKILTHPSKWQHQYRPAPPQRQALDRAIDWAKQVRLVQPDEVADFAWSNALPVEYAEAAIQERLARARGRIKEKKEREVLEKKQARERQIRVQESLHVKIAEVRAQHAADWEQRVRAAAARVGVPFEDAMIKFVSRQTLLLTSIGDADRILSNKALDENVRLYVRKQKAVAPLATGEMPAVPTREHRRRQERLKNPRKPTRDPGMKVTRRRRNWKKDEEDTLLDCEAIIQARSRGVPGKKGRSAMSQLFPDVGIQTFFNRLKKQFALPGKQAYFDQLKEAWYNVWIQYRGTDELPDPTPNKPNDFDLKTHLAFLRAKINKSQLRQSAMISAMTPVDDVADLPAKLSDVLATHEFKIKYPEPGGMESLLSHTITDEKRQATINDASLITDVSKRSAFAMDKASAIMRASMKMCIATPDDVFDHVQAKYLISQFPSNRLTREIKGLQEDKTIHRLSHSNAATTNGRQFVFSPTWLEKADGPFASEVHEQAEQLDRKFDDWENGIQWPVIGKAGELAQLMNMVSNDEVGFDFDLATAGCLHRDDGDYNTRRINDDSLEVNMRVFRAAPLSKQPEISTPSTHEIRSLVPWLGISDGSEQDYQQLNVIVTAVEASGSSGISRAELEFATKLSTDALDSAFSFLAREGAQRVFWAGYDTARLVSISHWDDWTLPCRTRVLTERGDPDYQKAVPRRCYPRRWIDIWGEVIESEWRRSIRSMIGHFVYQSNMTEVRCSSFFLQPFLYRGLKADIE